MKEYLELIESQLRSQLDVSRKLYSHSVIKGSHLEQSFGQMLESYLPKKYDIGTGQIIDSFNITSPQIDIIITDDNHPLRYNKYTPGLFFIDGVSAIGEVKSVLTNQKLKDTIEHSKKAKKLKRIYNKNDTISTCKSDQERFYLHPPYFLFAFESKMTTRNIIDTLKNEIPNINMGLDAVFVLDQEPIINLGDGKGSLKGKTDGNKVLTGWMIDKYNTVLSGLLLWLHATMPKVIRFESVMINYLKNE